MKPDLDQMKQFGYQGKDEEEGAIEERISQIRAEEILDLYKKLKVKSDFAHGAGSASEPLLDTKVKDQLFIETGEDIDDIFAAFAHYKLNFEISEEDKKRYE